MHHTTPVGPVRTEEIISSAQVKIQLPRFLKINVEFACCSAHEDLSIHVSFTTGEEILTKLC